MMQSLVVQKRSLGAILLPLIFFALALLISQPAYASCFSSPSGQTTLSFNFCDYGRDFPGPGTGAAIITVTDPSAIKDPTAIDTVTVTVTSLADPSGIQLVLKETAPNTGVFTGQLEFMTGNYIFPQSRSITVTENYVGLPPPPATLSENVRSDHAGANPITITLPESGANTGVYKAQLNFGGFSSSTQDTIFAEGGDYVQYSTLGAATWMQLIPNSDTSKGIIQVNPTTDDQITATYNGVSESVTEGLRYGGGGGGGGVVAPSLVLDATAGVGGINGGGEAPPPLTFSLHSLAAANVLPQDIESVLSDQDALTPIEPTNQTAAQVGVPFYPLTIDGRGYLLGGYANTIDTVTEQVGKPMTLALGTISRPVVHISLFTNIHSLYDTMSDSDTYIVYDTGKPLQIVDPHGFFSNVTLTPVINGTKQSFVYGITFAKPMNTSNIIIRAWDDEKSSADMTIYDAWQVTPPIEVSSQNTTQSDEFSSLLTQKIAQMPVQDNATSTGLLDVIKEWGGYSPTSISDSQLLSEIGIDGKSIPPWFMKTAKWAVQGDESQQDFVNGIKYLYDKGLIH